MLLIKNAKIYTMETEVIEKGEILIESGKIKAVGSKVDAPEDVVIIDAEGKIVLPGMIDAHCHLGMWEDSIGFEGSDGNETTDPLTPHMRAIDGINPTDRTFQEAYSGGITTVCTGPGSANVIGGTFVTMKTFGKRIDDMIIKNPAAMKIAFGENPKRVYGANHKMPYTRMAIAALLRETLIKAQNYKEKLEANSDNPEKKPDKDIRMESLLPVLRREIPLKAHAHRADDIFTALRIAKEFNLDLTLEHATEGHLIADYIAAEGNYVISGPHLGTRTKYELKNKTFENPAILQKHNIKFAIMTDHPVIPVQDLPICAGLASAEGLSEIDSLKAITINPAEILGISDRVGSIKEGKDADIVIFNGHPFNLTSKVDLVLIDGNIVYERK